MMAYAELATGIYMLGMIAFVETNNGISTLLLKAPFPVLGALIAADALARLGWIGM